MPHASDPTAAPASAAPTATAHEDGGRGDTLPCDGLRAGVEVTVRWAQGPSGSSRAEVVRIDGPLLVLALVCPPDQPPGRGTGLTVHRATADAALVLPCEVREVRRGGAGCLLVCRARGRAATLDRRSERRVPVRVTGRIHRPDGHRPVPAELTDISPGGVALVTTWDAEPGTRLTVSIDDDPGGASDVVVVTREVAAPHSPLQILRCRVV